MDLIEKSIIKTYRKEIWNKFIKAINNYNLIEANDKIAVCISGGKDSFLLAKCLQELQRHGKFDFDLKYIMINPGYDEKYLKHIKDNATKLKINLEIFDTDIFEVVKKINHKSNCFICSKMRRGHLYSIAKELGCNKIALGHHLDDVIETTFLNMFYNGIYETMRPILNSDNFDGMKLIRPLYLVEEKSVIKWQTYNDLIFKDYNCGFKKDLSKRIYLKKIINELRSGNNFFNANIINALEKVNLNNLNGYILDKEDHRNY